MHSVLFLVLDFLFVAALYVLLGRAVPRGHPDAGLRRRHRRAVPVRGHAGEPEAAAGGVRGSAPAHASSGSGWRRRCWWSSARSPRSATRGRLPAGRRRPAMPVTGNTEQVGWLLYTSYLIPFEIASMLLLVAMIGAIVLAKREL